MAWGPLSFQWISTLYLLCVSSSLVDVCSHLSLWQGNSLIVIVGMLSRCGRVLFSNWEVGVSYMVVMRRGTLSTCNVQEATGYLWQGGPPA